MKPRKPRGKQTNARPKEVPFVVARLVPVSRTLPASGTLAQDGGTRTTHEPQSLSRVDFRGISS